MQVVIFTLGNEKFALETSLVHGIEKMMNITKRQKNRIIIQEPHLNYSS
jgi:chemotaxis signal transduction protein